VQKRQIGNTIELIANGKKAVSFFTATLLRFNFPQGIYAQGIMKIIRWVIVFLSVITGLSARAAQDQHVVLITIDGFPAYMLADPKLSVPNIRKLAQSGAMAEGMRPANPTVTWPNHTTLVTGLRADQHGVLYNGVLVRGAPGAPVKVDPRRDKSELVAVPTIVDRFHDSGLSTAAIDWPCTRNSKSLDIDFPDSPEPLSHSTPEFVRLMVERGILPDGKDATFSGMNGPARDEVWTRAACLAIEEKKPNFLLLHLLNTDGIHHRYGPQSTASLTALALADTFVGRVVDALEAAGIRKNTTIIVAADHGFAVSTNILQPNVLLKKAGLLEVDAKNQIIRARAQVVPEGGTGMLYLTNPETKEADLKKVLEILGGKSEMLEILTPDQYASEGLPSPGANPHMADLTLIARDGYCVSGSAAGDEFLAHPGLQTNLGYHGYVASNSKMNAIFVASGRGIKQGAKLGVIENVDVAPTIAHLLGQPLPQSAGKILSEILAEP
jgi:arylsulfatase A-like enzyme